MFKKLISILIFALLVSGTAWGATYTDFTSGDNTLSRSAVNPEHDYVNFIHYREFDLGASGLNEGSGVTRGDVIRLFEVEANTIITEIGLRVTTAAVYNGVYADLGDGNDPNGYVNSHTGQTVYGIPYVDLSHTYSGITRFSAEGYPFTSAYHIGDAGATGDNTGASTFVVSGVSVTFNMNSVAGADISAGVSTIGYVEMQTNLGPYFSSGITPYLDGDTIDLTIYTDTADVLPIGSTGVTPVFEAYIKGFKRVP